MKIEVNGSLNIEQLIELASHGNKLFNNGLALRKFPVQNTEKRIVDVKLITFPKKDRYCLDDLIKEKGFRSLYIEELLQFSYIFPNKQVKHKIVTLGCFKYGNHGKAYPYLGMGFFGKLRQIGTTYIDSHTEFQNTKFAVTQI